MRLLLLGLLLSATACAQVGASTDTPDAPTALVESGATESAAARTATEVAIEALIAEPGIHVVHFWAPWCGNSRAEFESGWYEVVDAHPDVSFSFVTIWNDGDAAADRLARYGITEGANVGVFAQPDRGPSADRELRRNTFLGLPLSWTPTTWIFNREGTLAVAINYGEVSADILTSLIESAASDWMHD